MFSFANIDDGMGCDRRWYSLIISDWLVVRTLVQCQAMQTFLTLSILRNLQPSRSKIISHHEVMAIRRAIPSDFQAIAEACAAAFMDEECQHLHVPKSLATDYQPPQI